MPNKKKLYIIGAGDFGRELENWLDMVPTNDRDWEIAGFLHSGENSLANYPSDYTVLGDWMDFSFGKDDLCIIAVASSRWKRKISDFLAGKVNFLSFIHPTAIVNKFVTFQEGVIICPCVVVSTNVHLGRFVMVNSGTQLGHDVEIGDYSSVMANVDLAGHVKIGKDVFIGSNVVIIPRKKIADNVVVGAGSVVIRNVKEKCTVFGNPAKKLL